MNNTATETIVAVASGHGRAGVGVVRLSGPSAGRIAEKMTGTLPEPRRAALRGFQDRSGQIVDRGLMLWFPAPASFTGEDVVELQGHGGPVLLQMLVRIACEHGARPARPGEFSERAYLNGRIDLAQAEAIADLVDAASSDAAKAALRSLDGEFSQRVDDLAETLTALRVRVEGALDFSDEDIDWLADQALLGGLQQLIEDVEALLQQATQGRRLNEGLTLAIAGRPNVGKSTLLNHLAGNDAAIVTDQAGTTRDVLREHLVLDGLPVTVIDTAGLRESLDIVEQEGVRRAWKSFEQADVLLYLLDDSSGVTEEDAAMMARLPPAPKRVLIRNKCDLTGQSPARWNEAGQTVIRLAAREDRGMPLLRETLRTLAGLEARHEGLFSARTRHLEALRHCLGHLQTAPERLRSGGMSELAAEELRLAQQALGEITGVFTSEDLLGRIFSSFCIGK